MNVTLELLISVLLIASIDMVVGDHLGIAGDLHLSTPSTQIDKCTTDNSLSSATDHASDEKVFVGSIKSNKYHYPDCQ